MTLILTAATPYYVVQLSDRLVTAGKGDHDTASNKTLVYRARDALVSIGYSGLAYLENVPTDEWLAQLLWGEKLHRGRDGVRPCKTIGKAPCLRDIGQAISHLEEAIRTLADKHIDTYGLWLTVVGWQSIGRRGARPIIVEVSRHQGRTVVERSPRHWARNQNFRIHSIGASLPSGRIQAGFLPFRGKKGRLGPEQVESALAEIIRETAGRNRTVGSHLLSVVIPRPDLGPPLCKFLPMTRHLAVMVGRGHTATVPIAHMPWIIGPGLVHPPSMVVGDVILETGGGMILLGGAEQTGRLLGLSSSIRRPPPLR